MIKLNLIENIITFGSTIQSSNVLQSYQNTGHFFGKEFPVDLPVSIFLFQLIQTTVDDINAILTDRGSLTGYSIQKKVLEHRHEILEDVVTGDVTART